jgi:hypothetical protein
MNSGLYPAWLKEAKLMLLSKKAGAVCAIEDTRGIQLLSFLFKVVEKIVYTKAQASGVFNTGEYQAGFKKGRSCQTDQVRLMAEINRDRRRKGNRQIYTLLDISQAFDRVNREKLWKIIDRRIQAHREAALAKGASPEEMNKFDELEVVMTVLKLLY